MFAAVGEADDSTTVNLSGYGRFIPGAGSQLVTVGAKFLRLFRVNPYSLTPPQEPTEEWAQKVALENVFSIRLLGPVQDMATARIPLFPSADALLLAFDDAKISVVGISPTDRSLQTISLHSFESDDLKEGFSINYEPPIIRADPDSRCAAMLCYGRAIAVLPFQEGVSHIHSYTVKLSQIDTRLENVLDMQFLYGYYEPTLLFLYEPLQTTAGRASIRSDTCCIMGVSLNTMDRQQAVVWQMTSLPMDCYRLQPIPQPVGGAVVFGANEAIYLNQSVPPCGVSLNSCIDGFTKFPLKDMKHLSLVLDASESTVLTSGRIAVGTREGALYLFTLETDTTNSVRGMDVKRVLDISQPCCLTACASGQLFVGSRLGDSQFLSYDVEQEETVEDGGPAPPKKPALEDLDDDDRLLYGDAEEKEDEAVTTRTQEKWQFRELDRLVNIGPVLSMTSGAATDLSSVFDGSRADPIFDIVTASGKDRDGCMCILQRTLRPQITSSFPIEGAQHLWAVGAREDGSHRYLIVGRDRQTLVLELLDEMVEVEAPIFVFDEETIAAGDLVDGAIAVQITQNSICLVGSEGEQLQCMPVDSNFPVAAACISDPFIALLTENGRLLLYKLETGKRSDVYLKELDLSTTQLAASSGVAITAMSLYRDMSGLMVRESSGGGSRKKRRDERMRRDVKKPAAEEEKMEEDEDDLDDLLLYGENKKAEKKKEEESFFSRKRRRVVVAASAIGGEESDAIDPNSVVPSHWIVVAKEDGKVAIYELPTLSLVYQVHKFAGLPEVIHDATGFEEERERKEQEAGKAGDGGDTEAIQKPEERVVEILLTGMGINQGRPVLFAVLDDVAVAYEAFQADNENDGHLSIRFRRQPFTRPVRNSPFMGADGKRANVDCVREEWRGGVLTPFERVGGVMNGVFLAGPNPCFVIMGAWGGLRAQPFTLDGRILSFTPFNNELVFFGFLYLAEDNHTMRVARLNPKMNYELPIATRKVPIDKTVHFVRYCLQSQVYVVVTSRSHRSNRLCSLANDEKQIDSHPRPDTFVCPSLEEYAVDLYSSEDWKAIPNTGITLQEMEVVTACEEVLLRSESTISGFQNYVAIGTINNYGEEVLIRGRILLVEIIEVVPEPGQPTSKHKMKLLYDKEQKGPVTALCGCNGFLLSGMGQKVFIWQFKDGDLQGISFLDMHYYVHSLCSVRALALACDVFSSLSLVRFQEQFKALSMASRDDRPNANPPMASAFIVDNDHLGLAMSDEAGNLFIFNYLPREGATGDSLNVRGAVCIGTRINAFLRVKGHTSSLVTLSPAEKKEAAMQQTTLWSSLDGSLGYARSLGEKQFRRLYCLQQSMANVVPQACGLNPRGARVSRPVVPTPQGESNRNVVDMDVVGQFMHISMGDKQELARKLGGNKYQMMDDLVLMDKLRTFF